VRGESTYVHIYKDSIFGTIAKCGNQGCEERDKYHSVKARVQILHFMLAFSEKLKIRCVDK
jgi:hypothetical protein